MTIQPKFFTADTYDYARYAEWYAFRWLAYNKSHSDIRRAYPDLAKSEQKWATRYQSFIGLETHKKWGGKVTRLKKLMQDLSEGRVTTIEDFQGRLANEVLRTKSTATAKQNAYTHARTEAVKAKRASDNQPFINNNKLLSKAHIAGAALAHTSWDEEQLKAVANQLEQDFCSEPLRSDEFDLLVSRLKEKTLRMEAQMLEQEAQLLRNPKDKVSQNAYIIYGFFKLHLEVGETKAMSDTTIRKETPFGPDAFNKAVSLLIKLKLIKRTEKGKQGSVIRQANIYKRLA